jgi:hypothetical protein
MFRNKTTSVSPLHMNKQASSPERKSRISLGYVLPHKEKFCYDLSNFFEHGEVKYAYMIWLAFITK